MKRIKLSILFLITAATLYAVPAYRGPLTHRQSDGTELTIYQHGDEYFHYFTNESGQWMQADDHGDLCIAPALTNEQIKLRRAPALANATGVDRTLSPRGPVILVNYTDKEFSSTLADMVDWAMGSNYSYNGATGSIHQYFYDVSYGQYDLQLDVFGPVTVDHDYAYYGTDGSSLGSDKHPDELVVEACKQAVAYGADFSQYDYDNDGYVDWVVIIYAGKGQADGGSSTTIWPHQSDLHNYGKAFKSNGKTIDHYCMLNEINGQSGDRVGIGTFVHEFSHVMGLPDFYATNDGKWKTSGMWDIMDYGPYNNDGRTPPAYSAYERWFMGWISPTQIKGEATVMLNNINNGRYGAYITPNEESISDILRPYPNVFYMLETRHQSGWDQYIPGNGLLITKISYKYNLWRTNTVNNTEGALGIDLIEADGVTPNYSQYHRDNGYFGKATDAFPAGADSYNGINNFRLTDITKRGQRVFFNVNGGGEPIIINALEQVNDNQHNTLKFLRNGQIIIQRGDELYTLSGKRID